MTENKSPDPDKHDSGRGLSAVAIFIVIGWAGHTLLANSSPQPRRLPHQAQAVNDEAPIIKAQASSEGEAKEMLATVINLNGFLCARVTEAVFIEQNKNLMEVTCIEYRGGKGTVRYIVDVKSMVAFKAG